MKKTKILGLSIFSLSALCALATLTTSGALLRGDAETTEVWNHYSGVAATLDNPGIKEYWVSCLTHEHVFTRPDVDDSKITDQGAPSLSFIKSLSSSDDRLIDKYKRGFNFDDGVNPYISIKDRFNTLEVQNDVGLDGTKALVASYTGTSAVDAHLSISKAYLDAVFADPEVKSLSFAAKGTIATNNFRHKQVDQSFTHDNKYLISCYEANATNYGITTEWKTFYLSRGVYSQMTDSDWFIQYGATGPFTLYLDEFRISYTDYADRSKVTFENGFLNGQVLRHADGTGQKAFEVNGSVVTSTGFDYDHATEGNRALTFTKENGYIALFVGADYVTNMPESGMFLEMNATVGINASVGNLKYGNNENYPSNYSPVGLTKTLYIPKSKITGDGRFLIIQGSTAGTFYIDNVRYADVITESFEDAHAYVYGEYGYAINYKLADQTASNVARDNARNVTILSEWNTVTAAEIVTDFATHGSDSFKLTLRAAGPLAFNRTYFDMMDDDSVLTMDVYPESMTFGEGTPFEGIPMGQWTTVTLKKADFVDGNRFLAGGYFSKGVVYFDNLTLVL